MGARERPNAGHSFVVKSDPRYHRNGVGGRNVAEMEISSDWVACTFGHSG